MAERAPGVRRDGGLEARDAAAAGGGVAHGGEIALRRVAEDLDEQLGLGREVAIERPGGDAGALGDRLHRRGRVAALLEQRARRIDQALARGAGWRRCGSSRSRFLGRACPATAANAHAGAAPFRAVVTPSIAACNCRWKWVIAPSNRPNSKYSFAPLASPHWIAQATSRSSMAPAWTKFRPVCTAARSSASPSGRSVSV